MNDSVQKECQKLTTQCEEIWIDDSINFEVGDEQLTDEVIDVSTDGVEVIDEDKQSQEEIIEPIKKQFENYSFATKEEGIQYYLSNQEYFNNFVQNDLDYRLNKKDATLEEFLEFAKEQILEFTDKDKELIEKTIASLEEICNKNGYTIPKHKPIVFIKTTMLEECDAGAYTHGTQIYIGNDLLNYDDIDIDIYAKYILAHEIFHTLTRSNPEFRADMYSLIHFKVQENDFELPESVKEYIITNPDVEHHNSYATFNITGKEIDCYMAFISTQHFEKEGDIFFDYSKPVLVPIDGSNIYYEIEEASNFYEILGNNTGYNIDPEEVLAGNFGILFSYWEAGTGLL